MAKKKLKVWKATEVVQLLRERYAGDKYAFFEQVPNATGFACNSWVDAAVIHLWPSEGLRRAAFEVKVSRSDFIREVNDPKKNKWAREYFHTFWFVMPASCVKDESEIPKGAGWLAPHGTKLVIKRQAQVNEDARIDDELLCALARSISKAKSFLERDIRQTFYEKDKMYLRARAYEDAVNRFLAERKTSCYYRGDVPEIDMLIKKLESATSDKSVQDEQEMFHNLVENYQDKLVDLFDLFVVMTRKSLFDRDERGNLVISRYGYLDNEEKSRGWEHSKTEAKSRKDKLATLMKFFKELGLD